MTTDTTPHPSASGERHVRRAAIVLGAATATSGLLAGTYYAYACSVMPGLRGTSDRSFIDTMQHISTAIQNPVFFATFLGAPAVTIWAAVNAHRRSDATAMRWITGAAGLHMLALMTTAVFNIPLNDTLVHADSAQRLASGQLHQLRADFETPWTVWNIARTVATTAATGMLIRAAFLRRPR